MPVDLGDAGGPDLLIHAAAERHGRLDVLVNNLGATRPRSSFLDIDDAEWRHVFDLTFFSAVRTSRAGDGGAIVNISSINARLPFPTVVDYSAAKAALSNLTKALSEEFAPQGVRVNAIAPGPVRTPFWTDPGGGSPTPRPPAPAKAPRRPSTRSSPNRWASPPDASPSPGK